MCGEQFDHLNDSFFDTILHAVKWDYNEFAKCQVFAKKSKLKAIYSILFPLNERRVESVIFFVAMSGGMKQNHMRDFQCCLPF